MSFLSNLRLAHEDDEVVNSDEVITDQPTEIDVSEAIQAEEDALEVAELQENIEAEEEEIEIQSEVADELQEQNDTIEEKLETPEEVTPEDVVVAQEAFAFTLGRLAKSSGVYKSYKTTKISSEHARKDPITSLKLHQEGIKDVLKSVWESLKTMFKKIMAWCAKMYQKAIAMFTNFEKKANALKGKVDGNKTYDEKTTKDLIAKHLPFTAYLKENKIGDSLDTIASLVGVNKKASDIVNNIINKNVNFTASGASGVLNSDVADFSDTSNIIQELFAPDMLPMVTSFMEKSKEIGSEIVKILNDKYAEIFGESEMNGKISFKANNMWLYTADYSENLKFYVFPIYIDGQGLHFAQCQAYLSASLLTWDFKHGLLKYDSNISINVKGPENANDVNHILDSLIKYSKAKNELIKSSDLTSKAANKLIDAVGKVGSALGDLTGAESKQISASAKTTMNYAKFVVSNLTTMVIKQYIYLGKAYLSFVSALLSEKSESDSK